jgi:hypothetical protein
VIQTSTSTNSLSLGESPLGIFGDREERREPLGSGMKDKAFFGL